MEQLLKLLPAFIIIATAAVIVLTDVIKGYDKNNRLKGWRVWIPAILSGVMSVLLGYGGFFERRQIFFWWAVIFAFAILFYESFWKKWRAWNQS